MCSYTTVYLALLLKYAHFALSICFNTFVFYKNTSDLHASESPIGRLDGGLLNGEILARLKFWYMPLRKQKEREKRRLVYGKYNAFNATLKRLALCAAICNL